MVDGFVSIDLGGTNIACALSDTDMKLLEKPSLAKRLCSTMPGWPPSENCATELVEKK